MGQLRNAAGQFSGGVMGAFMSDREARMGWRAVSSSNVAEVGYDAETSTLGVRFLNGSEYEYYNVPEMDFEGLVNATSVGKYLHFYIKGSFPYERVG